jgi:V8-like Glu-specific endopeptidase
MIIVGQGSGAVPLSVRSRGKAGKILRNTNIAAVSIAVVVVAGLTAFLPAAARATGTSVPARGAISQDTVATHSTGESSRQMAAFWTPQRLAAAKNMDLLTAARPMAGLGGVAGQAEPAGRVQSMPPVQPAAGAVPAVAEGLPGKHSRVWSTHAVTTKPASTIGELFFMIGSRSHSCTATVISAPNKSTIWTAGHCVSDGHGHWYKDFEFEPAIHASTAPLGEFAATFVTSPDAWVRHSRSAYDYAAMVLDSSSQGKVEDVAGSQGWMMGGDRYNWPGLYIFGYPEYLTPGKVPVNQDLLRVCTGPAAEDSRYLMMYFSCNIGNGAGGPLLYGMNRRTGSGWLIGDISLENDSNWTRWSPQLGSVALATYHHAYRR